MWICCLSKIFCIYLKIIVNLDETEDFKTIDILNLAQCYKELLFFICIILNYILNKYFKLFLMQSYLFFFYSKLNADDT